MLTNAMNEVSSVRVFSWELESPPQVLYLYQGVAMYEARDLVLLNPTPHS